MIKVLVFGMTANPGGMESVVMNYYRNIDRSRIHFDFLCYKNQPAYKDEIERLGGHIFVMPGRRAGYFKNKKAMEDFFKNHGREYDAIWENANSLTDIRPLVLAKKYGIRKRIIHAHNSANMDQSFITGFLHKINKKKIDDVATDYWSCSESASDWMFNEGTKNSDKYWLVNNAINLDDFRFNSEIRNKVRAEFGDEKHFVIGHVGRLQLQKNQIFMLDVFKQVHERNKDAVLWIIGEGPDREKVENGIKERNLEDCVRMLGVRSDVKKLYNGMDAFLLPSLFEGLPVVLVEAQTNGLKCYVSDAVSTQSRFIDTIEFISLNKSPEEWAEIIVDSDNSRCENAVEYIDRAGFNIKTEVSKFTERIK